MNLTDLAQTVAKYAPALGAVLPIPGGAALGTAIAQMFGGDITKPDDLIKKINSDPDAALKLFTLQSNERIEIKRLQNEKMRIENEDLANARNREIEISKTPIQDRDKQPFHIAMIFICCYFALSSLIVVALWTKNISAEEIKPIIQLLKDLGMISTLIFTYFFGRQVIK